jgi:hypothetical protein
VITEGFFGAAGFATGAGAGAGAGGAGCATGAGGGGAGFATGAGGGAGFSGSLAHAATSAKQAVAAMNAFLVVMWFSSPFLSTTTERI